MTRLTKAEKDLICTMCNIAESNYALAQQNDPVRGEGDYEGWTESDFKRADAIFTKLFDVKGFANKFTDGKGDLGAASRAIVAKGGR
jgi:hypothetical protein